MLFHQILPTIGSNSLEPNQLLPRQVKFFYVSHKARQLGFLLKSCWNQTLLFVNLSSNVVAFLKALCKVGPVTRFLSKFDLKNRLFLKIDSQKHWFIKKPSRNCISVFTKSVNSQCWYITLIFNASYNDLIMYQKNHPILDPSVSEK